MADYTGKGYWGKCIEVDMTTGTINITDRHMQYVEEYVGGHSLGAKMLWEALKDKPDTDPMGPDNILMIIPGPTAGVPIAGAASRYCIYTKSPVTQALNPLYGENSATILFSSGGGKFAPEFKRAGYDMIYITGAASTPKYLYINNDVVELRDADKYWGMTTVAFEQAIQEEFGYDFKNICIGPAGENGVRYAALMAETGRAAGRGGGAVAGSKKLKGIVVRGTKVVPIADPDGLQEFREQIKNTVLASSACDGYRRWGTARLLETNSVVSQKSVRNHREGVDPNCAAISAVASQTTFWTRHRACFCCPFRCMKAGVVKSGKYKGAIAEGPEYESAMNSSNWLISDMGAFGAIMETLEENGFDLIGIGGVVAFVMEAFEMGHLKAEDLGGISCTWGDADGAIALMEKLASDDTSIDVINWLRRGSRYTADKIGQDSYKYAMDVKYASFAAWAVGPMAGGGRAMGYSTVNRGACHVNGVNPTAQNSMMVRDMGDFCSFSGGTYAYADVLNFVMGRSLTVDQYAFIADKAFNLEKVFNLCQGFTREDDLLPWRTYNDPCQWGPNAGQVYAYDTHMAALDAYYEERGWDKATGVPTEGKLQEVGLDDCIPYIQALSK